MSGVLTSCSCVQEIRQGEPFPDHVRRRVDPYAPAPRLILSPDIVERFQLSLMLSVIAIRNMIEMAGSDLAFLPKSFTRGKSLLDAIMSVSTDT